MRTRRPAVAQAWKLCKSLAKAVCCCRRWQALGLALALNPVLTPGRRPRGKTGLQGGGEHAARGASAEFHIFPGARFATGCIQIFAGCDGRLAGCSLGRVSVLGGQYESSMKLSTRAYPWMVYVHDLRRWLGAYKSGEPSGDPSAGPRHWNTTKKGFSTLELGGTEGAACCPL